MELSRLSRKYWFARRGTDMRPVCTGAPPLGCMNAATRLLSNSSSKARSAQPSGASWTSDRSTSKDYTSHQIRLEITRSRQHHCESKAENP
eukprot:6489135-Amphidinium_carterae.2